MREKIEVYVERCRDDVILPTYANKYDAGMDIRSCVDITIKPNETVIVPTGLKFAIPEGYEIQVRPLLRFVVQNSTLILKRTRYILCRL